MTVETKPFDGRLQRLDALRGLAAIAVVLFHFTSRFPEMYPGGRAPFSVDLGFYGVHLFFMISGFVIVMSIEHRSGASFVRSRFIRLYPAFWASVLLTTLVLTIDPVLGPPPGLVQILANLTMFEEFIKIPPIDGAYWSLTYELGFYAMMFGIFLTPLRKKLRWLPLWMVCGALAFPLIKSFIPAPLHLVIGINDYSHLFGCGIALYLARQQGWTIQSALPLSLVPLVQAQHDGMIGAVVVGTAVMLMIWGTLPGRRMPALARPVLWFGTISYALYLTHQMIGYVLLARLQQAGFTDWLALIVTCAAMVALATLVTFGIENPSARWLKTNLPAFDFVSLRRLSGVSRPSLLPKANPESASAARSVRQCRLHRRSDSTVR